MGDCPEDSEDASSIGEEERVRRLFQACDGDGDGFIDGQDLLNVCRKLNLEDSLEELMKELGADDQGRISYQEFLRRQLALKPEIDAIKSSSRPTQPEYLPTSSDNSLGEGKMSWEFDSGARDLSPEPHSLQQLVSASSHPASGNLLELANKLHLAALASLKNDILDLSNRLQFATQERDQLEKALSKSEIERIKVEKKLEEESQLHEEQLTELHSVIAELTRKVQHQRSMVIREEEDISETDEVSGGVECSQTLPPDEEVADQTIDASSTSEDVDQGDAGLGKVDEDPEDEDEAEDEDVVEVNYKVELEKYKADKAVLEERLSRALSDLETISRLNAKKVPEVPSAIDIVRVARVSSPSRMLERSSPSLLPESVPSGRRSPTVPVAKLAERIRLKKVENHVTGSDIATFGVCHTKVAEHLVSDLQEESDLQELSRCDVDICKQHEMENERLNSKLEHVKAQNTVLALTLDESKSQCDRLSLLVGKYESNATALKIALTCSEEALVLAQCLMRLLETELSVLLTNCRMTGEDKDHARHLRKATDNRRDAEKCAKDLLMKIDKCNVGNDWSSSDEKKLRDYFIKLKQEKSLVKTTVVELESPHVEPLSAVSSVAEARKLDLETAVLMQELMSMREDKAELRARIHLLEKERTTQELRVDAQSAHLQSLLQAIHQLQAQINEDRQNSPESSDCCKSKESRLKERMEELVGTLDKVTKNSELRHQQNTELVLDLRAANTALVSTLDRCKKKYLGRLKKLESQMMALVERHAEQVQTLKQRIAVLERNNNLRRCPESTI